MAKAEYHWDCPQCGKDCYIRHTFPNRKSADNWLEFKKGYSDLCYDCKIKNQNNIAEIKSQKLNLPELKGSEKQVSWANSIRLNYIENFYPKETNLILSIIKFFNNYEITNPEKELTQEELDKIRDKAKETYNVLTETYDKMICSCLSAKFYIEKINPLVKNSVCIFCVGPRSFDADFFIRLSENPNAKKAINSELSKLFLAGFDDFCYTIKIGKNYLTMAEED